MWRILRRAIVPALLVILGLLAIAQGVLYHRIPVVVEEEIKTTIDLPLPTPPASPDANSSSAPFVLPAMIKKTVTRIEKSTLIISEPELTRDLTIGGVVLLASGGLKRTYSSGKGPASCPT
jgi:hypothetical protein